MKKRFFQIYLGYLEMKEEKVSFITLVVHTPMLSTIALLDNAFKTIRNQAWPLPLKKRGETKSIIRPMQVFLLLKTYKYLLEYTL